MSKLTELLESALAEARKDEVVKKQANQEGWWVYQIVGNTLSPIYFLGAEGIKTRAATLLTSDGHHFLASGHANVVIWANGSVVTP